MRESAGGLKIFGMVVVFFFIFVMLLAVSINYAQAFRVKNKIIDYIEQYEGFYLVSQGDSLDVGTAKEQIDVYINEVGYFTFENGQDAARTGDYEVCRRDIVRNSIRGRIYKVTTFVTLHLPFIFDDIKIPIIGETKFISKPNVDYDADDENGLPSCN